MNDQPTGSTPDFSVVVPCYNEEGAIERTIDHLREKLGDPSRYELIIVNDGSSDGSPELLAAAASRDPTLRILHHQRNRGYGAALKTGIASARSPLIVITDADGTYPNEQIPALVEEARGYDMLVGARTGQNVTYSKVRAMPKIFLRRWASWLAGQDIPDINSGLRVFRKDAAERFLTVLPDTFSFTTTITLCMLTNYCPVRYVPIDYMHRVGKSKIKPIRDTLRFMMLIMRTGMYFAPLRLLAPVFLVMALATFASLVYDVSLGNFTDKTVILLMFTMNVGIFALLADMIDKRSSK